MDDIAQYDVYAYDDSECVHDYIGEDLDIAEQSFESLKSIHSQNPIKEDITIVLYDNLNQKVIKDYNTLKDA